MFDWTIVAVDKSLPNGSVHFFFFSQRKNPICWFLMVELWGWGIIVEYSRRGKKRAGCTSVIRFATHEKATAKKSWYCAWTTMTMTTTKDEPWHARCFSLFSTLTKTTVYLCCILVKVYFSLLLEEDKVDQWSWKKKIIEALFLSCGMSNHSFVLFFVLFFWHYHWFHEGKGIT